MRVVKVIDVLEGGDASKFNRGVSELIDNSVVNGGNVLFAEASVGGKLAEDTNSSVC
jgi:hypothetical protein